MFHNRFLYQHFLIKTFSIVIFRYNDIPLDSVAVYYRVLVNFTKSIEYDDELEDFNSERFTEVSEAIIDTLESQFIRIPGEQTVTVVLIEKVGEDIIVQLDVGSEGNNNDQEIEDVVYSMARSGSFGPYQSSTSGFLFRRLGTVDEDQEGQCQSTEFTCKSGDCIPIAYFCDDQPDCLDMSDEDEPIPTRTQLRTTPATQTRTLTPRLPVMAPTTDRALPLRPCSTDQAVCQNGQCIPRDYLCDSEKDCEDGSDELDCGTQSPCEPNEFKCRNGHCALKLWRCDGDTDCADGSDEEYCPTKGPGDMCAPEQFVCVSSRTCIPASYQCDEEPDCPDRSDEFGCTSPQVVTLPEETVQTTRGATVTLTCVATGVPTPIITWRLNWGPIPVSSRTSMTSQNGQGTLIIRDVKESDQGAYTCEAINAKGMIFAIPDAVLILRSNSGNCPGGHFSVDGSQRCIPCFCFGVTKICDATGRYQTQISLRFNENDDFKGVSVTVPAQSGTPPLSTSQILVDTDSAELQLVDLSRRFLNHDSFWTLPRQFLGNKVDSYGGFLRYKIRYSLGRGQSEPENKADVIIVGNGKKLIYKVKRPSQPSVTNQKEIQFLEDNWQHASGGAVTREDLMMALVNLEKLMIRAKYDNRMASVGLSDVVMDTTTAGFTRLGKAQMVEECRCPTGYTGLSCETCAAGFNRIQTSPYLGTCNGCNCNSHASTCDKVTGHCLSCQHNTEGSRCDKCRAGYFGNPTLGTPSDCMPCPCPFTGPSRRFSNTCFLDTDKRPTCDACAEGYTGRRCEKCASGYEGNPMIEGGGCKQLNVVGRLCNKCSPGSFHLDAANVAGCLTCFCMGVTQQCASSTWHRDQVSPQPAKQELTNMANTLLLAEGIRISGLNELAFGGFDAIPQDVLYWVLPDRFKGDKVTSYGGELRYIILHRVSPGSPPIIDRPDVVLQGNNIFLEYYSTSRPKPGVPTTFTVPLRESGWRRTNGQPCSREHLLMALAQIDLLMIRATFAEKMLETRISKIRMDIAVPHYTGQEQAVEVEECICPQGYRGPSCQNCASGYTRTAGGLYLGTCEPCNCFGHSNECDEDTGKCRSCQDNTEGKHCERCRPGFYGDAKGRTHSDCQVCPCPGTTASNQFSPTCFLDSDGRPTCDNCHSGYGGRNCERYSHSVSPPGCSCDGRGSATDRCDASGLCQCKSNVEGRNCNMCRTGFFFLDAGNRDGCLPCFCMGVTQQCRSSTYYRDTIVTPFFPPSNFQNFALVNRQRTTKITSGFTVEITNEEPLLSFRHFGPESYFWQLPEPYQGDKVASYGGRLKYTLSYNAGYRASSVPDSDVQITGNDITLVANHHEQLRARETKTFEIVFKEQLWKRPDGQAATREHLLMVLADLDEILIRATFTTDMISASIGGVSMETAVAAYTSRIQAQEVEECRCPPGYTGLSCQDCAPGYARTGGGLYLGHCELCECSGHSESCHPETRVCSGCLHGTTGEFCNFCAAGYYGDATAGTPEDCQRCACPLSSQENQFSPTCESSRDGGYRCTSCAPGYTGQYCESCAPGYTGNPNIPGQKCLPFGTLVFGVGADRVTVSRGDRVQLKCQVSGQGPYRYSWTRADGRPLSRRVIQRNRGEELFIQEIEPSDAGVYLCVCRNAQSTNTSRAEVVVSVPPFKAITVTVEEPKIQTVRPGVTINFICTAKSQSPAYTLVWTRQLGGKLPDTAVDFNGILTIRNVRPEDAGGYICTGSNMFAMDEGSAVLHVPATAPSAPVAAIEPQILTVKQGQTAELRCTATGNPPPTLQWSGGQGSVISPNAVVRGGLLRIAAVERSDEAVYFCQARNSAGEHTARTIIYVQSNGNLPQVQVSPQQIDVYEGETVRLYCRAGGHPTPMLSWKKLGGVLPAQARAERTDIGTLIIPSIAAAHGGVYLCVGSNSAGSAEGLLTPTPTLTPTPPPASHPPSNQHLTPTVRVHPSPASVTEGGSLELVCQARGQPEPTLTWHRAGSALTANHQVCNLLPLRSGERECVSGRARVCECVSGRARVCECVSGRARVCECVSVSVTVSALCVFQVLGSRLQIVKATVADAGDYSCEAENSLGRERATVSVSVTSLSTRKSPTRSLFVTNSKWSIRLTLAFPVLPAARGSPPRVRVHPAQAFVTEGGSLELACQAQGQPEPTLTWHRMGSALTANHQVLGSRLQIVKATVADAGDYSCEAENSLGRERATVSVSVTSRSTRKSPTRSLARCLLAVLNFVALCDIKLFTQVNCCFGHSLTVFVYRCPAGQQSPIISTGPQEVTVIQGHNVSLKCEILEGAQPLRIEWITPSQQPQDNISITGAGTTITITNVRQTSHGQYKCVAGNRFGLAYSTVTLIVQGVPTVSVSPRGPVRLGVRDSITVECISKAEPRPVVSWHRIEGRQRKPLDAQTTQAGHSILKISSARVEDSGTYLCQAVNQLGSAESRVEVLVDLTPSAPTAPQITVEETTSVATTGGTTTLHCSATGYPTPVIQWSKLRAPLPWQHKIVNGSLVIPNLGLQDSGQYICNASNSAGFKEIFIMLDVESPPYATFNNEAVTVRVGEVIRLQCLAQGTPPLQYQWSKLGGKLPSRARIRDGVLQINLAVISDSDTYSCLVKNKVGESELQIHVLPPLAVRVTPQIDVKNIGGTVEFTCSVIGDPKPRIQWLKQGGHLPPDHKISKDVLRISNLQQENEGIYICRATSRYEQAQDSAKLTIQALPIVMINVRTSVQTVMIGGSVEFECQAIGDPQPVVGWSKVEGTLPPGVRIGNGMLKIANVKESDAGRYRCTATNQVGSVESEVVLHVQTIPRITPQPEIKEVAIGSSAVFPCLASGFPAPDVTWTKLEGDLPAGARVDNNVLTIQSATPEHTGTYVCTATNEQGTETAYAMLKVRDRVVPYFTQDPVSYIALPTIKDAYHKFEIRITFRPDAADGMIIYNGQKKTTGADFISFGLVGGRPEFRFDVGSGMATIRHPNPISLGEYHTVVLQRNLTQGSLSVDHNLPVSGTSQGSFRGLDLNEDLYVGGYPDFDNISKATGLDSGFMGCIRQLTIQGDEVIFSLPELRATGISNCPTCKDKPCKNGGNCVDSDTSRYVCLCKRGFTGSNCEHSQDLHCHPEACGPNATCVNRADGLPYICRCHLGKRGPKCMDGTLVTAPSFRGRESFVSYPALSNIHNELTIEMRFKPRSPTGLMFFSSGKRMKMNDFVSVALDNGFVEFRYDLGSGLAILQSLKPVTLNKWHQLRAHRYNKEGSLHVDNDLEVRQSSPGKSQGLNLRSPMYLGGVATSEALPKALSVTQGMDGCIAEVLINGKKVDLSYTFTASLNVGQCYDNLLCDTQPCLHGGTCLATAESEYQCLCPQQYQGERCEVYLEPCSQTNPCMNGGTCERNHCFCPMGFTGFICQRLGGTLSYLGLFLYFPPSTPRVPETIEMKVRTRTSNGLLLWQGVENGENGKGKDYVALGLRNGHLLFSYQLGSGEANILSEDPINDGEWHKITAVREGKSGHIQVDEDEVVRGESTGDKVMVNTKGSIYLGGAPDIKPFTGGKFTSGITGCIKDLLLLNQRPDQHYVEPIDLRVHAEGGVNAQECPS
uniref:Heparan sulfate proteoglycan 2 n=1 Tax=Callorhinchus milii TaxID=7868 RepID=A0A4W3GQQ4_CALMI